jgi:hypothetical protein
MKLGARFAQYREMVASLGPGARIPEVVVPFDEMRVRLKAMDTSGLAGAIAAHNAQFEKYGLKYVQNVMTAREERSLVAHTIGYMRAFGAKVEDEHLIQRDVATLDPLHPVIGKLRAAVAATCNVDEQAVMRAPNFNYYPCAETVLHAHHDNLFLADEIAVVTACSPRRITFRHWVTRESFDLYVEPRSMYIMSGEARYEYTHGGASDGETALGARVAQCLAPRMSFVLGVNTAHPEMQRSVAQVWGESAQRRALENTLGGPLPLAQYLELVKIVTRTESYHPLLARYVERLQRKLSSK